MTYVQCRCRDRCHLIGLEYTELDGLELQMKPAHTGRTFWGKFKECLAYLFCRRDNICCNDVLISPDAAGLFQDWLNLAIKNGYGTAFDYQPKDDNPA